MKRNSIYLLPVFLFLFFQCTEPPEPEAGINIFPNPQAGVVHVEVNLPLEPQPLTIYLYGVGEDIGSPAFESDVLERSYHVELFIPGAAGAYYMDVVVGGKAKRFKLFKDVSL